MGTIRCYVDAAGDEQMLYDHEGWTSAEVTGPHPTDPYMVHQDPDGTWWAGGFSTGMPAATGRYRPGCDCGWVGPRVDANDLPDDQAAWFRDNAGAWDIWPTEEGEELVMVPWRRHTDTAIGAATLAGAIADWSDAKDRLGTAIADLIAAGTTWDDIARQLSTTPTQAEQAWSAYQPTPPPPGPADEEWWDRLNADLRRATFVDPDLAVTSSLVAGDPQISRGRSRDGWEKSSTQAMATSLDLAGVEVLAVVDVAELHLSPSSWRDPIGGIRVRWDGHEVLVGIRVDEDGEVYPSSEDPADPRE